MTLGIGTTLHSNSSGGAHTYTPTITTLSSSGAIVLYLLVNGNLNAFSTSVTVSSSTLGSWGPARGFANSIGASDGEYEFVSPLFSSLLASEVITVTLNSSDFPIVSYVTIDVFEAEGAGTFDSHSGLPVTHSGSGADPLSISTSNANDLIFAGFRFAGTGSPTQGSTWTKISGADSQLVEYKIVSSAQTSLSVTVGTGAGDADAGIADAVIAATGGGGSNPGVLFHRAELPLLVGAGAMAAYNKLRANPRLSRREMFGLGRGLKT